MPTQTPIDVFISRKSEDAALGRQLYDFLSNHGLNVFDSDVSLPKLGNADYSRAIDEALASTRHLVVVGSAVAHINASWVESEWRFFLNRKRAGKASGNLITVVTPNINIQELPPSLQNFEVIPFPKAFDKLLYYLQTPSSDHPSAPTVTPSNRDEGSASFRNGRACYEDKQFDEAYLHWVKAAGQGVAEAHFFLGLLHWPGHDGGTDPSAAWHWYNKDAGAYSQASATLAALLLMEGKGIPDDPKEAYHRLHTSAQKGFAPAQCNLGVGLAMGLTDLGSPSEALVWLLRAADQDMPVAQYNIGCLHATGKGLPLNSEKALEWLTKAANQKLPDALFALGTLTLIESATPEASQRAEPLLQQAALLGNAAAAFNLGLMHHLGLGVPENVQKAGLWYQKAADRHHAEAWCNLGTLYAQREHAYAKAQECFHKAADLGSSAAHRHLGDMHALGHNMPVQPGLAAWWHLNAVEKGYNWANRSLKHYEPSNQWNPIGPIRCTTAAEIIDWALTH